MRYDAITLSAVPFKNNFHFHPFLFPLSVPGKFFFMRFKLAHWWSTILPLWNNLTVFCDDNCSYLVLFTCFRPKHSEIPRTTLKILKFFEQFSTCFLQSQHFRDPGFCSVSHIMSFIIFVLLLNRITFANKQTKKWTGKMKERRTGEDRNKEGRNWWARSEWTNGPSS